MRNKYLLFTFLFFILLTVYSLNIPFFWDGTFFSETAVNFYLDGVNEFIAPPNTDTGGFPLYPVYHALMWKLFGKSLLVSHLAMLPMLLACVYEYFKLAKRFLSEQMLPLAMIILICEPTFVTQGILMGYDILIGWFFLMALNALLDQRNKLFSLALLLLCCSSIRGIMLGVALLALDLVLHKKIPLAKFYKYLPAGILIFSWAIYHEQQTGWFFFSPDREDTHESFLPFSMMVRQAGFIAWKVNDLGRIVLWILLIVGGILLRKKMNAEGSQLLKIVFIPLLVLSLFMIPLANPIGHKYFLVVFLCLNIAVCYLIQHLNTKKLRLLAFSALAISLLAGNFWLYPERYGNAWDSSLKVLPYFELREKMDVYIDEANIEDVYVGTQYPLIDDPRFSTLKGWTLVGCFLHMNQYTNVWMGPIENYRYFLHSNVINTDIPDQIEEVKKTWKLVHEERRGQVYISLYENPNDSH